MDVSFLWDPRLSWAAKGLYTWLLSQPQGTPVQAAREVSANEQELIAALEELRSLGIMDLDNPMLGFGGGARNVEA